MASNTCEINVGRLMEIRVGAGYRSPPNDAVKHALGIDLADSKLLDEAIALVRARVDDLEALFAKQENR